MPTITDWLMVVITAVYVVATIFICCANLISAKATREQVTESKRQFEETRRLEIMPYFRFESSSGFLADHTFNLALVNGESKYGFEERSFSVTNVGKGTAKEITCIWNNLGGNSVQISNSITALQSGEMQKLKMVFALPSDKPENMTASIELRFKDLLNIQYTQIVQFEFVYLQNQLLFKDFNVTIPKLQKENQEVTNVQPILNNHL